MEPDTGSRTDSLPLFVPVRDTARLARLRVWTANEPAAWALRLFGSASGLMNPADRAPVYHVALVPGGNHAAVGFRLADGNRIDTFPHLPYIRLSEEDWVFTTTLLHETGHVVLAVLNSGNEIPKRPIASIPHSTAALTDRGTAFDEGFAIHLETLAGRLSDDPVVRKRYHHDRFLFGTGDIGSEYHRQTIDLLTYAQSRARYADVTENCFAFCSAFRGADYLRVQLEKSRDFAALRDADQLLQSEGFYASFFASLILRGNAGTGPDSVASRQERMLEALAGMFRNGGIDTETPFLIRFTTAYMAKYPAEAAGVADLLNELSHGVFVDPEAKTVWRTHYLNSLHLDLAERENKQLEARLVRWRASVLGTPELLSARIGPQLVCTVPDDSVRLVAFGDAEELSFDLNTAEEGVLRLIPGITDQEIGALTAARDAVPFSDAADFRTRSGLRPGVLSRLKF